MPELPNGTVTFLFTDIEGSTALWERDRKAMAQAVDRHLALLRIAIGAHEGILFKIVGDAVQAAFPVARQALTGAVEAQRAFQTEPWSDPPGPLQVRMALHTGEAHPHDGDYLASPLNRLARLLAAAHGSQILLTQAVQQLVRDDLPPEVALKDLGTHRLRDLQEPEAVFQAVAPGLPERFPPLRALPSYPTNLTAPPTALLGRGEEVAGVLQLLAEGTRLVTLTGPGGSGKTRLAQEVAAEALERYPDGVFFVDLAPIRAADYVVPTIASVLGVREHPEEPLPKTLNRYLAERWMLLVLDNCEQVLEAAGNVAALLAQCPQLAVLATSREPLRVRGERVVPVSPLPLPDLQRLPDLPALAQVPSVTLFVERAQAVDPSFALTEDNASATAAICWRLDGLPLAIELAAARVRLLPPEALLARLERSLPFLTRGARDAPARQRTLRETIAWSHALLSSAERALFRRLSVFVGGWTVEAAEAVTNPDGTLDVLEGLANLVERSLVRRVEEAAGELRFGLLETIREYGLEQLHASGEALAMRTAHAAYVLALTEQAEPGLFGGQERTWLARLDTELDNIRAALAWSATGPNAATGLRLGASLWWYWHMRGLESEGRRWLDQALARRAEVSPDVLVNALIVAGTLAVFQRDDEQGRVLLEESLVLARERADTFRIARAQCMLGALHAWRGDAEPGRALLESCLPVFRELHNATWTGFTLVFLGYTAMLKNDFEQAIQLMDENLAVTQGSGWRSGQAMALGALGMAARGRGDYAQAASLSRAALALRWEHANLPGTAEELVSMADVAAGLGDPERAVRLLGAAARLRESHGLPGLEAYNAAHDKVVRTTRTALGDDGFAEAWAAGQALRLEEAIAEAMAEAEDPVVATPPPSTGRSGPRPDQA
jgi:predicted ATPase/class 3 adenylate cyclase